MTQMQIVLSGIYRRDPKTLSVLEELKQGLIKPEGARKKLFGAVRTEPSFCCLLVLVQRKKWFVCQILDELKAGVLSLDFATEEMLSIVEEECPAVRKAAISKAA